MAFTRLTAAGVLVVSALAGCVEDTGAPGTPAVGGSTDRSSFEGARAGQAEMGIQSLGYSAFRSEGLTTWWFNASTGSCARITTSEGRYSDVTMLPNGDC